MPYSMLFVCIIGAGLAMFLSSCSSGPPVQRDTRPSPNSFVFVIHGDGDYLYHDPGGLERRADEKALSDAILVAERNADAEVFIFHQRPARRFMFLIPLQSGDFYYYRGGVRIAHESYQRGQERTGLAPEVRMFRQFHPGGQDGQLSVFVYFGHAIPEVGGTGYDASYPGREFTVRALSEGLQGFASDSSRFDLVVLSTCFGGTPFTIDAVGKYARYIIASPENLHLSHFDVQSMERVEIGKRGGDIGRFAKRFARDAFDRLAQDVYTEVSVVVYDVDRVQEFVRSVRGEYEETVRALQDGSEGPIGKGEYCDCADLPGFGRAMAAEGVNVFYRPARFGRSRTTQTHSGWQCLKHGAVGAAILEGPEGSTTQELPSHK